MVMLMAHTFSSSSHNTIMRCGNGCASAPDNNEASCPPTPHPVISLPYSRLDFIMRCNGNHHGQSGRIYKTGGHKSTQRGFKGRLDEPEVEQMHRFRQDAYYQIFLRHHQKIKQKNACTVSCVYIDAGNITTE